MPVRVGEQCRRPHWVTLEYQGRYFCWNSRGILRGLVTLIGVQSAFSGKDKNSDYTSPFLNSCQAFTCIVGHVDVVFRILAKSIYKYTLYLIIDVVMIASWFTCE